MYWQPLDLAILSTSPTFLLSTLLPMTTMGQAPLASLISLIQTSMSSTEDLLERSTKRRILLHQRQNQFLISAKSSLPLKSQKVTWSWEPFLARKYLSWVSTPRVASQQLGQSLVRYLEMKEDLPVCWLPTRAILAWTIYLWEGTLSFFGFQSIRFVQEKQCMEKAFFTIKFYKVSKFEFLISEMVQIQVIHSRQNKSQHMQKNMIFIKNDINAQQLGSQYFICGGFQLKRYKIYLMRATYFYPTNNFGHHNNVHYYFYSRYVEQGNNWANYGLHQVQIRNESSSPIEVVGWTMKEGRVEEDFKTNVIRPGLFYTARLVPNSWGSYKAIIGAVTIKVQGTNETYTLSFEDPFHDYVNKGYKGHIEQGNDAGRAISSLRDHAPKSQPWGQYEFHEFEGRGKTVFTFTGRK